MATESKYLIHFNNICFIPGGLIRNQMEKKKNKTMAKT